MLSLKAATTFENIVNCNPMFYILEIIYHVPRTEFNNCVKTEHTVTYFCSFYTTVVPNSFKIVY